MRSVCFSAILGGLSIVSLVACGDDSPAAPVERVMDPAQGSDAGEPVEVGSDAGGEPEIHDAAVPLTCAEGKIPCGICIDAIAPTGEAIQTRVLKGSCGLSDSCHGGISPQEHLGLASLDQLFDHAVGKPSKQRPELSIIEPGKPEESYLIHKLRNLDIAEESTDGKPAKRMPPPPGDALCEAKIAALEAWIAAGAPR